jgi:hypothetical protein
MTKASCRVIYHSCRSTRTTSMWSILSLSDGNNRRCVRHVFVLPVITSFNQNTAYSWQCISYLGWCGISGHKIFSTRTFAGLSANYHDDVQLRLGNVSIASVWSDVRPWLANHSSLPFSSQLIQVHCQCTKCANALYYLVGNKRISNLRQFFRATGYRPTPLGRLVRMTFSYPQLHNTYRTPSARGTGSGCQSLGTLFRDRLKAIIQESSSLVH